MHINIMKREILYFAKIFNAQPAYCNTSAQCIQWWDCIVHQSCRYTQPIYTSKSPQKNACIPFCVGIGTNSHKTIFVNKLKQQHSL